MNEKDYQYTLTIAKCQSFSRAAELLYLSQPALSRYISTLEKKLGVPLFDRSATPIQLTKAGEQFCACGNAVLDLERALYQKLREDSRLSSEPIKIGVPLVVGEYLLSRIIPRVTKAHPHIKIDPVQDTVGNLRRRVSAHQLDAVIVCTPVDDDKICSDLLCRDAIYLVGRRDYPPLAKYDTSSADLEHPLILDPSTLHDTALIHCKPIAVMSYVVEDALRRRHFKPSMEIKASSLPLAIDLASQGLGLTSVMCCQLKYGHPNITQALCPILLEECSLPFYLAYSSQGRRTTPELDLFIQEVLAEYQSAPHI